MATQCFSATTPCEAGVIAPLEAVMYIRQPLSRVEEIPGRRVVNCGNVPLATVFLS